MEFRIGINLGDVIEDGERIYGDGVNIAARIESLAEGGAICISGTSYDQVKNKLNLGYENLGEHSVKNIAEPVRVYRILMEPNMVGKLIGEKKSKRMRTAVIALSIIVVLLVAGALVVWNAYFSLPSVEATSGRKITFDLPKGPSIAVLPFVNISGDPEQDYFSDGLTENIITGLSGCPKLFVIARNSTFTYKGQPVKVQQVARELGVQYVVEGSVQRAKDQVRITVQLIDAATGHHLWAEKYDRELKNIFALQDEIALKLITALEVELTEGEQARLRLKWQSNLEAWMKALKGLEYMRRQNKEDNVLARREAEEAIALAPGNPNFYILLAGTHIMDMWWRSSTSQLISYAQATNNLNKAFALDKDNSDAHIILGMLYLFKRQHKKAITAAERAVALNPNGADAYCQLAFILCMSGRSAESIDLFKKAFRLNPIPPSYYFTMLGEAYLYLGRYEEAIQVYKQAKDREPRDIFSYLSLAAVYIKAGMFEKARIEAAEVYRLDPKFSLKDLDIPHINPEVTKDWYNTLRQAGLK
jgi:adenylate cyclase